MEASIILKGSLSVLLQIMDYAESLENQGEEIQGSIDTGASPFGVMPPIIGVANPTSGTVEIPPAKGKRKTKAEKDAEAAASAALPLPGQSAPFPGVTFPGAAAAQPAHVPTTNDPNIGWMPQQNQVAQPFATNVPSPFGAAAPVAQPQPSGLLDQIHAVITPYLADVNFRAWMTKELGQFGANSLDTLNPMHYPEVLASIQKALAGGQ